MAVLQTYVDFRPVEARDFDGVILQENRLRQEHAVHLWSEIECLMPQSLHENTTSQVVWRGRSLALIQYMKIISYHQPWLMTCNSRDTIHVSHPSWIEFIRNKDDANSSAPYLIPPGKWCINEISISSGEWVICFMLSALTTNYIISIPTKMPSATSPSKWTECALC